MRAVLDPNIIISALLSSGGRPAQVLRAWRSGTFELVVSAALLDELERALAYSKLRERITQDETRDVIAWLKRAATIAADPEGEPPARSPDPGDDYLLGLAAAERAALVSGDGHLLSLAGELPILSAADFLALLEEGE